MRSRTLGLSMRWMAAAGALSVGLVVPLACGGKVVFVELGAGGATSTTTTTGTTSTTSQSGTGGVVFSSTSASTPSDAIAVGVGGSTGDAPPCISCASAIGQGNGSELCPGNPANAFKDLINCACATGCPASCGDNLCGSQSPSMTCIECLQSTCGSQWMACESS